MRSSGVESARKRVAGADSFVQLLDALRRDEPPKILAVANAMRGAEPAATSDKLMMGILHESVGTTAVFSRNRNCR
jgi:hypothetical protein